MDHSRSRTAITALEFTEQELVRVVGDPRLYGSSELSVSVIQTHISVVVICGQDVYKFKKRVSFGFVDFLSLKARRVACEEEIAQNSRLCPQVYHGVAELRKIADSFVLGGKEGVIVDYAVWMRRLPEELMLSELIAQGGATSEGLRKLARLVARFHATAARDDDVLKAGAPAKLRDYALANFSELRQTKQDFLSKELLDGLEQRTATDFTRILPTLERRASEGHLVDGHGDLHARNVCMTEPPTVYDCIEFSQALRCGDTANENAFLYMDLLYRDRRDLAEAYLGEYIEVTGDDEQRDLLLPLCRYRAMVRAKVSVLRALEIGQRDGDVIEAQNSATRHLLLATALGLEESSPLWVLSCGLPGTGKSTQLEALRRVTAWTTLSTDRIRKEMARVPEDQRLMANSYTTASSHKVYEATLARANETRCTLLDAGFRTRETRRQAVQAASQAGARCALIWVRTDEEKALSWLKKRHTTGGSESDADASTYKKLKAQFEEPSSTEGVQVIPIDGSADPMKNAEKVLTALSRAGRVCAFE